MYEGQSFLSIPHTISAKMNLSVCIFLWTIITAGQAFPKIRDWDWDLCEIKLYRTSRPQERSMMAQLPGDTKTRIRSKVQSFWVTGNRCCWEIRKKGRLVTRIHDNQDKWKYVRHPFLIRKCRP